MLSPNVTKIKEKFSRFKSCVTDQILPLSSESNKQSTENVYFERKCHFIFKPHFSKHKMNELIFIALKVNKNLMFRM